jgi:arginine decarboxylase
VTADPRGLRSDAPLLDAYLRFLESGPSPFTIPGHKQRTDLVGSVVAGDVPLYGGLDTVKVERGVLAAAEARAADLWGAVVCRFSVGGSTHGNQALALAVAQPGDHVVVPRTLHRSLLLGLVLAGLVPIWLRPRLDPGTGLPLGTDPDDVSRLLREHPRARAVFLGDPSYVGTCSDLAAIADRVHDHDIPLVVDAAWAGHFGFHPDLPPHALAQGADALVTSAHKTLPAYSQAALVLARTERLDADRLERAVEATQTTSPAGAILASIDAARALVSRDGRELIGRLVAHVRFARDRLSKVDGVVVLDGPQVDPAKLVVLLGGTGADGNAVERDLVEAGMPLEMADLDCLVPMLTVADDREQVRAFVEALETSIERRRGRPRKVAGSGWELQPSPVLPPREAFFARHEKVAIDHAIGRTCAEVGAPYPPGVPVLAPGEEITGVALDLLRAARARGTRIAYAADPDLRTLTVVAR